MEEHELSPIPSEWSGGMRVCNYLKNNEKWWAQKDLNGAAIGLRPADYETTLEAAFGPVTRRKISVFPAGIFIAAETDPIPNLGEFG